MKDIFSGQNIQRAFQNPLTMAGFAVMQGAPMGKALMEATQVSRENELKQAHAAQYQAETQKLAHAKLFAQNLPEIIKGLGATSMEDAIGKLTAASGDPKLAIEIAKGVRPDINDQVIADALGGYHVIRKENGQVVGNGSMGGNTMPIGASSPGKNNIYTNSIAGIKKSGEAEIDEQKEINKETRKYTTEVNAKADEASESLQTIRQMKSLADQFYQGPGAEGLQAFGKGLNAVGGPDLGAAAAETFKAQSNKLILDISKDQAGNQSNSDMDRITATSPELTKTPEGNKNLLNALEALNLRREQKAEALQEYLKVPGNTAEGFKTIWRKYVNAFPLINKDESGFLQIKKDNLSNWNQITDPDFDQQIKSLRGASTINPVQSSPDKKKGSNGKLYTIEQLRALGAR